MEMMCWSGLRIATVYRRPAIKQMDRSIPELTEDQTKLKYIYAYHSCREDEVVAELEDALL
jgi:hypothetical protein